jgi:hypothetical protein
MAIVGVGRLGERLGEGELREVLETGDVVE